MKPVNKEQEEEIEQSQAEFQHLIDLDKLIPSEHNWVDRGLVMSCEGGAHPHHQAFKRQS